MIYVIKPEKHSERDLKDILEKNKQIRFVSFVGVDSVGNDTDEKIPIDILLSDYNKLMKKGVQTDGSSVQLPGIAEIQDARVDLLPDTSVNWYVDYNYDNIDIATKLPIGTLRIPAFLVHNDTEEVGSRAILKDAEALFKKELLNLLNDHPYVLDDLPISSFKDIKDIVLTAATEMEFYVKTPHEVADKDRLHTSQELKEQYWKRTVGPVRTSLENTIRVLNNYDFGVEMGHKEVGGVMAELGGSGFDHIMEQLEIDWSYSSPMQTADNDRHARYVIKDVFRQSGLDVTFMAKPVDEVAGSGKHVHFGVVAILNDGRKVNLFTPRYPEAEFMTPIGLGALMGMLKNYEIISPIANCTNDAFNRLKPGYEAPVSIVTALGRSVESPSRNRTVLIGLIRDFENPMATRFELRSPNPKSNTYMILAAGYLAMLDGISAALNAEKSSAELTASISKAYGEEDFYLEKDRMYRSEDNVFEKYSAEERDLYFGITPATVWENLSAFENYPKKTQILLEGGVMTSDDLNSFISAAESNWAMELHDRVIPAYKDQVASFVKLHGDEGNALDKERWEKIEKEKKSLIKDDVDDISFTSLLSGALEAGLFDKASELQLIVAERISKLSKLYAEYKRNIY